VEVATMSFFCLDDAPDMGHQEFATVLTKHGGPELLSQHCQSMSYGSRL